MVKELGKRMYTAVQGTRIRDKNRGEPDMPEAVARCTCVSAARGSAVPGVSQVPTRCLLGFQRERSQPSVCLTQEFVLNKRLTMRPKPDTVLQERSGSRHFADSLQRFYSAWRRSHLPVIYLSQILTYKGT